ncbi:hypothetical protein, partial [Escherichia coli]
RSLYFEHLFPGEDGYSRSESLWLVRGGVLRLDEGHRLTGERQTVHHPQTEALLWQHETRHAYNAQGLANRC